MTTAEFQKHGVNDARLAVYATSHLPAWLWSLDGTRVLWANPVGADIFGARTGTMLSAKSLGPADPRRRQIAQLAGRLRPDGGIRLERLRGFGAPLGRLLSCACSRLALSDGGSGVLVVAAEPVGRTMPLIERLQRLVEGSDAPMAAFGRDGLFVGASEPARALMAFRSLSDAGLDAARTTALKDGRVETPIGVGRIVLQRVGSGPDVGLVALLAPGMTITAPTPPQETAPPQPEADAPPEPQAVATLPPAVADPSEPQTFTEAADDSGDLLVEPLPDRDVPDGDVAGRDVADRDVPPSTADATRDVMSNDIPAEFALLDDLDDETASGSASADIAMPDALSSSFEPPGAAPAPVHPEATPQPVPPTPRRNPLRFTWTIDDRGRFTLRSDDFVRLIGPKTAASFGRPWPDIAHDLGLDPNDHVARAVASHTTWSGVTLQWPVDPPGDPLPVEMAGLPVFDASSQFAGYRGFGVVRDLDALGRLDAIRNDDSRADEDAPARSLSAHAPTPSVSDIADAIAPPPSHPTEPDPVDTPQTFAPPDSASQNVIPIRPLADPASPALTPVENNAFNELARRLSARLDSDDVIDAPSSQTGPEPFAGHQPTPDETPPLPPITTTIAADTGDWLSRPPAVAQGKSLRDRPLLDLLPVGVLVYRLDRLLYANPHFLDRVGHPDLASLEAAGGLDALYVEPSIAADSAGAGSGTPVTIAAKADQAPAAAHLSSISWDGEPALALVFAHAPSEPAASVPVSIVEPLPHVPAPGHPGAEELAAILDTAAEGIVMFDLSGKIHSCNRSAEALFGRDGDTLTKGSLVDLFAPESLRDVQDYFDAVAQGDASNMHGRDVLGRVPSGGLLPLGITMGRTLPDGPNFFAIFRDQSQARKIDTELLAARKQADRFVSAKMDLLARISHEVRTPLNAIIGFSDVMIEERFGTLGNARYGDYIKDIRGCGERVIAIIDDLLDLTKIETGDLDLAFASQNLNELIEQCVAVMQPQANRERIIIRTSLAHHLPTVHADARALRQIAINLISNSIHLANAGGQVIVSTALSDLGHVILRVRDTGHGLNDNEIAQAMEPFRTRAPTDRGPETAAVNLSLTRALVEANRAQFNIKTAPQSGTLIEVVFAPARVEA